jgi:hypothetical protein
VQHKAPGTLRTDIRNYEKWSKPALGDIPLQEIDLAAMERLVATLRRRGCSRRPRRACGLVSAVWNRARAHGIVFHACPVKCLTLPRRDHRRLRCLTEGEARRLLDVLRTRSEDLYGEAVLALFAGLRRRRTG